LRSSILMVYYHILLRIPIEHFSAVFPTRILSAFLVFPILIIYIYIYIYIYISSDQHKYRVGWWQRSTLSSFGKCLLRIPIETLAYVTSGFQ
jgi:hypothetical protein